MSKLGRLVFAAAGIVSAIAVSLPALAQESAEPIPARVRYFEGTVTVQRAHAGETSSAIVNLPLDAGDRLWTGPEGRAEIAFEDGSIVWLARQTTVDVVALPRAGTASAPILRLWSGALIAERPRDYVVASMRIDTADAITELRGAGTFRLDLDEEHRLWVSVYAGEATVSAGGVIELVTDGGQSWVDAGAAPAAAVAFNTAGTDEFSNWRTARWSAYAETERHVRQRDYVPARVRPYAADLEANGTWFYYDDFDSWAWRPAVATSWTPYRNGRWVYSYGGWTWVPYSSWGWATVHYGRWHHLPSRGWVWFPGSVYRPAWVSWYVGGSYLGWCPIGFYNRPFLSINLFFDGHYGYGRGYHGRYNYDNPRGRRPLGGYAVAGNGYAKPRDGDQAWTFTQAAALGRGDTSGRTFSRTAIPRPASQSAVAFDGTLKPRNPTTLTSLARPRPEGGISTLSDGRVSTRPRAVSRNPAATAGSSIGSQARGDNPRGISSGTRPGAQTRPRPAPSATGRRPSIGGTANDTRAPAKPSIGSRAPSRAPTKPSIGSRAPSRAPTRPSIGSRAPSRTPTKPRIGSRAPAQAPTRPSIGSRAPTQAPTRPSVGSRAPTQAPTRPSIGSRAPTQAPTRPSIGSRAPSRAPTRPSVGSRAPSRAPSRPSVSSRAPSRAPSRPSVSSRAPARRPAARPAPRSSGSKSRSKAKPRGKPRGQG